MRQGRVFKALLAASFIWAFVAGLTLLIYAAIAMNCCSPVDYPEAIAVNQAYAQFGWITTEEANRRIATARAEFLDWVWGQVEMPLTLSLVIIPMLASFILRSEIQQN